MTAAEAKLRRVEQLLAGWEAGVNQPRPGPARDDLGDGWLAEAALQLRYVLEPGWGDADEVTL